MPSWRAATAAGRVLEVSGPGGELLFMLFPHLAGLRVDRVADTGEAVVLRACCRAAQARCPACGAVSSRVHGGYGRVVAALGAPAHSSAVLRLVMALPDPPAGAAPQVTG